MAYIIFYFIISLYLLRFINNMLMFHINKSIIKILDGSNLFEKLPLTLIMKFFP